jgi:hypothetical protein
MTMQIAIATSGYPQMMARLDRLQSDLSHNKAGLVKIVRRIGDVWKKNFDEEGQMVGGWPALAEMTQAIRESQGFSPTHPILERSGALRKAVVDFVTNARDSGTGTYADTYGGPSTTSTLTVTDGQAVIVAKGWKVSNQYNTAEHPARQFWFVDKSVLGAARTGLVEWITDDVLASWSKGL